MLRPPSSSRGAAVVCALLIMATGAPGQSDDFNDGDDAGWFHYDPLALPENAWEFPAGAYQLTAVANPLQAFSGGGRVGSFRTDTGYFDFCFEVDVLPGWDPAKNAGFGIVARIQPGSIGLGNTDGYSFSYVQLGQNVRLSRFTNEVPANLTVPLSLFLDPAATHRLVFTGNGPFLEGRIYALPDLVTPLAVVSAADLTWAGGHGGLLVFDNNGGQGADATFDNYRSSALVAPRLTIVQEGGDAVLSWPAFPRCYELQSNTSMDLVSWTAADLASISYSALSGTFSFREAPNPLKPAGFFRLVPTTP